MQFSQQQQQQQRDEEEQTKAVEAVVVHDKDKDKGEPGEESDDESYLIEVERIAKELETFTVRRATSVRGRPDRNAVVQRSTAAQAVAAATEHLRRRRQNASEESEDSAGHQPQQQLPQLHWQPNGSSQPQPRSQHSAPTEAAVRAGPQPLPAVTTAERDVLYANDKLRPFPGLFPSKGPGAAADAVAHHRPPPLSITPMPLAKAENVAETGDGPRPSAQAELPRTVEEPASTKGRSPALFSSLRRKASNAAARVASPRIGTDAEGDSSGGNSSPPSHSRPMSPTRRFFDGGVSFLSRRPSKRDVSPAKPRSASGPAAAAAAATATAATAMAASTTARSASVKREPALGRTDSSNSLTAHRSEAAAAAAERAKANLPLAPPLAADESMDTGLAAPASAAAASEATSSLAPSTAAMLHRYSHILTSPIDAAASLTPIVPGLRPEDMAKPPRAFIHAAPVLQVVTSSTVKDRFLFLFSDVLVIAKPIAPPMPHRQQKQQQQQQDAAQTGLPTIDWTFSVKNILDLHQVKMSIPSDHRPAQKTIPLMSRFVAEFKQDPDTALANLLGRTSLPNSPSTVAQLLHQTPELDKANLSAYLFGGDSLAASPGRVEAIKAFVGLEKLAGVSIESALRSLLLELRFPASLEAFEVLLTTFATLWTQANQGLIKPAFTAALATDLVFAIMTLNDALHLDPADDAADGHTHTGWGVADASQHRARPKATAPGLFGEAMPALTKTAFVSAFRQHDAAQVLSDRTLQRIYTSVRADSLSQALASDEPGPRYAIRVVGSGLPTKLIYGVVSDPIRVSIPRPDAELVVRLYGQDLSFDPPILTFDGKTTSTFTVVSKSLGPKHIVFVKAGRTARYYSGTVGDAEPGTTTALPRSLSLTVERAFMQHCIMLTLPSKRKYMVSVENDEQKRTWAWALKRALHDCAKAKVRPQLPLEASNAAAQATLYKAADAVALHVLRETLIEPDAAAAYPSSSGPGQLQRSASAAVAATGSSRMLPASLARAPSDSRALARPQQQLLQQQQQQHLQPQLHPQSDKSNLDRNRSISRHYYAAGGAGSGERELLPPMPASSSSSGASLAGPSTRQPLAGDRLILTVQQNSLLALVVANSHSHFQ